MWSIRTKLINTQPQRPLWLSTSWTLQAKNTWKQCRGRRRTAKEDVTSRKGTWTVNKWSRVGSRDSISKLTRRVHQLKGILGLSRRWRGSTWLNMRPLYLTSSTNCHKLDPSHSISAHRVPTTKRTGKRRNRCLLSTRSHSRRLWTTNQDQVTTS